MIVEIILAIFALIFLPCILFAWDGIDIRWRTLKSISKLPGPFAIPIIGMGLLAAIAPDRALPNLLYTYYKRERRLLAAYMIGVPVVVLKNPRDVEELLSSVNYIKKGVEYLTLRTWLNEGLLVSSGAKWHQRRKLLTPAFHFRILEDNLHSLNRHASILVRNMLKFDGKPFIAEKLVTLCTLDVICETAMGYQLNSQENQGMEYVKTVRSLSAIIVERVRKFWLRNEFIFNMSEVGKEFNKCLSRLHGFTEKIIKERRASYSALENSSQESKDQENKERKVFLDILLELDRSNPNLLTDLDIREEVDTFVFEGHDTTSTAITFALHSLGLYPEIQEKAYLEQYEIFGDSDRTPTKKELGEMHYLEMIIKEVLRMYPSVPYFSRKLTIDMKLSGGVVIPEGTNAVCLPYYLHRDPDYFPNPNVFDPERFTLENCKSRHPYSYVPFSAGPRNCIGQKFAMMELKVILSTLIRNLKIESVTKADEVKLFPFVIIRSTPPIQIKVTPRIVE